MDWFGRWAARHCTVFGMADEAGLATVLSWRPLFEAAGYSAADLEAATDWLAVNAPPTNRWEHVRAVQDAIRRARAIAYRQQSEALLEERGTCVLCGSSGWVTVPHPSAILDGDWRPLNAGAGPSCQTAAVLCSCPLGSWVGEHIKPDHERRKGPPMRLTQYQAINPRWRVQLEHRRREAQARCRLGPADPIWNERVKAMLERAGVAADL